MGDSKWTAEGCRYEVTYPEVPRMPLQQYLTNHIIQRHVGRGAESACVFTEPKWVLRKTLAEAWQEGKIVSAYDGQVTIRHTFDRKIGTCDGVSTSTVLLIARQSFGEWVLVSAYPVGRGQMWETEVAQRRDRTRGSWR